MRIGRSADDPSEADRDTLVVLRGLRTERSIDVLPLDLACRRIDRERVELRGNKQCAAVDRRSRLECPDRSERRNAHGLQSAGIRGVDFVERGEAIAAIALVVGDPVLRIGIGVVQLGLRRPTGRGLFDVGLDARREVGQRQHCARLTCGQRPPEIGGVIERLGAVGDAVALEDERQDVGGILRREFSGRRERHA